jgi:DNA-binding response OmpR family regulator
MKVDIEIEPRNKEPRRVSAPKGPSKRALVIHDEPAFRALIEDALGSADTEAVILGESAHAEEHFQAEKFDVIFIGLSGPAGGIELVKKIRKSGFNWKTPIIVISDDPRPGALPEGFAAGATFFVYKPIDRAHLNRLIRVTHGTIEHEIRRFRRVPVTAKVRLRSGNVELVGETIDLSLNGALVSAPHAFPRGAAVEVSLYLGSESKPIIGQGRVVRVLQDNQMAILLEGLPLEGSGRLQEYLLPKIGEIESQVKLPADASL